MNKVKTGQNLREPVRTVRHADLERVSEDSPFRSYCPVCNQGVLLVRRHDIPSLELSKLDNCSLCAQRFMYEEDVIAGEPVTLPKGYHSANLMIPETMDEAVDALHALLGEKDRTYILTSKESPDDIASTLHHSLGQHLRNLWGLWKQSALWRYLLLAHKIEHPDDMSHAIIVAYVAKYRIGPKTSWQRILDDD